MHERVLRPSCELNRVVRIFPLQKFLCQNNWMNMVALLNGAVVVYVTGLLQDSGSIPGSDETFVNPVLQIFISDSRCLLYRYNMYIFTRKSI